jgi:hypothetical protein
LGSGKSWSKDATVFPRRGGTFAEWSADAAEWQAGKIPSAGIRRTVD